MKMQKVIEITAESYLEEQCVLARFPDSIWINLGENRTKFYIKYEKLKEVQKFLKDELKGDQV